MSDLDDLQRLQQQLDEGKITAEEYARERAWILGSTAEETTDAAKADHAASPRASHVIDLHEIEQHEERAPEVKERKPIPTVWKAILIAFAVWILLIVTGIVWLRIRDARAADKVISSVTQTQQGSVTAQSAAEALQDGTAEATYEAFTAQLETTLATYYGDNHSITDDGKTLTISLVGDGIAADAMYVVQGVDGAAAIWSELKTSMQNLAVTCYDGANANTPERHVVLNILNDQNEENAILSYLDGQCIYDATEN